MATASTPPAPVAVEWSKIYAVAMGSVDKLSDAQMVDAVESGDIKTVMRVRAGKATSDLSDLDFWVFRANRSIKCLKFEGFHCPTHPSTIHRFGPGWGRGSGDGHQFTRCDP